MTRRITANNAPNIAAAVGYVAEHPGCAILPVAEWVGPHGSRRYGYATVHRAIAHGMLENRSDGYRYDLHITPRGAAMLAAA